MLDEIASKVLRTYWSVASFQSLYARANELDARRTAAASRRRSTAGRCREVHRLAAEVDDALEDFDTARAGRALAGYIDDLSNWYVRRSRRRFWDGDPAALSTLHECLHVLTRLLAPFVPFVTERVWRRCSPPTSASTRCTWRRGREPIPARDRRTSSREQVAAGAAPGRARPRRRAPSRR